MKEIPSQTEAPRDKMHIPKTAESVLSAEQITAIKISSKAEQQTQIAKLRQELSADEMVVEESSLITEDPELQALYHDIIEAGNFES